MKLEFCAGSVVYRKNKSKLEFLLILDSYDKWAIPKGHIEKKEKPLVAALRETTEETGLQKIKRVADLGKNDFWFKANYENNELIHKYVYYFLLKTTASEKIKPQLEEIQDAKWFSKNEILKTIGYKNLIPIFKKAMKYLETNHE